MMNLVNDQFGYLIACIERPEDPPGAMPNSLSFASVKDLFGKHFAVHCMETTVNDKGIKDHTFLLASDKVLTTEGLTRSPDLELRPKIQIF